MAVTPPAALRRAGASVTAGWPSRRFPSLNRTSSGPGRDHARRRRRGGVDPASLRVVLRIVEAAGREQELALRLPELAGAGVDEIIVDVSLERGEAPTSTRGFREVGRA